MFDLQPQPVCYTDVCVCVCVCMVFVCICVCVCLCTCVFVYVFELWYIYIKERRAKDKKTINQAPPSALLPRWYRDSINEPRSLLPWKHLWMRKDPVTVETVWMRNCLIGVTLFVAAYAGEKKFFIIITILIILNIIAIMLIESIDKYSS